MSETISHILNRGVERRKIFLSQKDYLRFIHNLEDFNSQEITSLSYRNRRKYADAKRSEVTPPKSPLVDVICWCLIANHFHIMAREKIDKGASAFAQKLTVGYTMYFNPRHQRNGTLFQGRTKIIPILRDAHFLHLPFYILANPLDLFEPRWREKGIKNPKRAFRYLENYRWSAFRDLIGNQNFPKSINKEIFFDLFETNEKKLRDDFLEWLAGYSQDEDWTRF
ncbi:MAG: hypothetical protein HY472_00130 [Candidatus Sungbacteria bacterium]|nr:hypothetical protein [Candidatus Sungbacteria bacterium]